MFRTVFPSIIRSSKLHIWQKAYVKQLLIAAEVACWPLVPKFTGSNPAEAVGYLRVNENPQHVGGHGCLSVVSVVCCQVEVSATS